LDFVKWRSVAVVLAIVAAVACFGLYSRVRVDLSGGLKPGGEVSSSELE